MSNANAEEVTKPGVESAVAIAGHPIHAMSVHFPIALILSTLGADVFYWWTGDPFWTRVALWAIGFGFWFGVAAGLAGTAELLFVPVLRKRVASWTHAIAAMTLLAVAGANWGVRLGDHEASVLPLGIFLSLLGGVFVGVAGWHGGKLVFHHGVGIVISNRE